MENEIFADGIGNIGIDGGVVRLDLVSLSPTVKDENKKPTLVFKQRVVLPVEGFLRSFSAMEGFVKQLVNAGIIQPVKKQETKEEAVSKDSPQSPNFS